MKKINILKENRDFNRIINSCKPYKDSNFVIYLEWNSSNINHFGISVGKKIGNAVIRNKYKRRTKSIIDKKEYKTGFNCIIILRNSILKYEYIEFEQALFKAFHNLKIIKESNNEK